MEKIIGKDKDITIADDVKFVLETTDGDDCLLNPYQITNVTIYFITREFTDSVASEYNREQNNEDLLKQYREIKRDLCAKLKQNVKVATTENISLSAEQNIDGVNIQEGDRVLVKNQNNQYENGIYVASEDQWKRSIDADSKENVTRGMYLFVENGIKNIDTGWVLECPSNIDIDSTPLVFFKFSTTDDPKDAPNENSKVKLESIKNQLEQSKKISSFYYKDAVPVKTFGGYVDPNTGELFPAWLNPSMVPIELAEKVSSDNLLVQYEENGEFVDGKFVINWQPLDCREGDYFICWSWMPHLAGEILSNHLFFSLEGSGQLTTSIPTHLASPKKYEILMERYLPDMFKTIISDSDLTPKVLQEFNNSIAKGFTFIENQANQIIDLLDANSIHEQLLPLLSNLFNLKLKSNDPTLWRRQVKKAIPNFKKKGSISGLKEALSDAGIKFLSLKKMWQVVSKYTYQEHFDYDGFNTFKLSKNIILPLDSTFKVWKRGANSDWQIVNNPQSIVSVNANNELIWSGDSLSNGDSLRVLYKIRNIPENERTLEDYIRSLPLMDNRDERNQSYPIKNWNTHLIEEDDDLFERIVPVRHPLSDPIVWGRIRTEFPYSENAYNMEEYNGSKRDSYNPCDIDKEFLDPCSQCQSSKFVLDLEVEKLSNESYEEIKKITEEYMPLHAVVHSLNLVGAINEYIKPSIEKVEALITFSREDILLAGEGQHIFNRDVDRSEIQDVKRNVLANFSVVSNGSETTWNGLMKNRKIVLCASGQNTTNDLNNYNFKNTNQGFEFKNINTAISSSDPFENGNLLEVLGTPNKNYSLSSFGPSSATVVFNEDLASMIGPLFEYRVSNKIGDFSVNIDQFDRVVFEDEDADFQILGIVTQHDVNMGLSNSTPWQLRISNKIYKIENIMPDGTLLLGEYSLTTPIDGWQIINQGSIVKQSNSNGTVRVTNYGLVELPSEEEAENIRIGDYVYIDWNSNLKKYKIKSFKKDEKNKFFIEDYQQGNVGSEQIKVYRRIIEDKVGKFEYEGLMLQTAANIDFLIEIGDAEADAEAGWPVEMKSNNLKENYLIIIDQKYYSISAIEGMVLILNGPLDDWTIDGEEVEFMIYKFNKQNLDLKERTLPAVPGHEFDFVDRSGKAIITMTQNNSLNLSLEILNASNNNEKIDLINQNESIDFDIEYKEEE